MLSDRVALVTGAGSGFGRVIGLRFAQEGARVGLADIDAAGAEDTRRRILAAGGDALAIPTDVTDWPSTRASVQQVLDRWRRLDIMVNAAGISIGERFLDLTEEGLDRTLAVNLKGVFHGIRAAAAPMKTARSGCVINLSFVPEEIDGLAGTASCAASGGVAMLTKAAAVELAPYGVRVCAIGAGAGVARPAPRLTEDWQVRESLPPRMPTGRFTEPEDVAGLAAFLASADAGYVTGVTVAAGGGELTR